MSEIPVHIYFVLDRSGSMEAIRDDVVGGFNAFLGEQRKQEGRCRLTMIQFDSHEPAELLYDAVEIGEVSELAAERFVPRGATPLLDAEGWMIARAREREKARARAGKPDEAVLFVTLTDGFENASREWSFESLTAAKKRAEAEGWAFSYLGCGHDAYAQSNRIGTAAAATRSYTVGEVRSALADVTRMATRYRGRALGGLRTLSSELWSDGTD